MEHRIIFPFFKAPESQANRKYCFCCDRNYVYVKSRDVRMADCVCSSLMICRNCGCCEYHCKCERIKMIKYHKIQSVYKRNPETKYKTFLTGEWSIPALGYLADLEWVWTEKIDGTNIRIGWDGQTVTLGGRTDNAQIPAFLVNRLQELFPADKLNAIFPDTELTIFGEGYGAKIQKGGGNYIPDGQSFILFDVWIGCWLERDNVHDIARKLGIDVVPIISQGSLKGAINLVKWGFDSFVGDCKAEGLVMRPSVELQDRMGRRIITKVKHKDFANE